MAREEMLGDEVMVGGHRIPIELLDPAFAGIDDPQLARAIARAVGSTTEPFPADGWRVFEDTGDTVVVGSDGNGLRGWATWTFKREGDEFKRGNCSWDQKVKPVPEDLGRGLVLSFVTGPLRINRKIKHPRAALQISNLTTHRIKLEFGEPALGAVLDPKTGARIYHESGPWGIGGVGRRQALGPGETSDPISVLFLGVRFDQLPKGEYTLTAGVDELALEARGRLIVSR